MHPGEMFKDCEECKKYVFVGGKIHIDSDGKKVKRPVAVPPKCHLCMKAKLTELMPENWQTFAMYKRHKHMGLEPVERQDELVRAHMVLIAEWEDTSRRIEEIKLFSAKMGL